MTLHPTPVTPIPEETARVARAAVPKGNVYLQMRDVLGTIYSDEHFADLFARRGRPAVPPWRLALVTVMQFAEGLSDRQAAEAVRVRIDWKYALGLDPRAGSPAGPLPAGTGQQGRYALRDPAAARSHGRGHGPRTPDTVAQWDSACEHAPLALRPTGTGFLNLPTVSIPDSTPDGDVVDMRYCVLYQNKWLLHCFGEVQLLLPGQSRFDLVDT